MEKKKRVINPYFVLILILLVLTIWVSMWSKADTDYSKTQLTKDLTEEQVVDVKIQPNEEAPTGTLTVTLKDGNVKTLYATDVTELEAMVREAGVEPQILDIPRESWFLSYVLPILIVLIAGVFIFVVYNARGNSEIGRAHV